VGLTVTDDDGLTGTTETSATIFAPSVNLPPEAEFQREFFAAVNQPTRFLADDSRDRDGLIVSYDWTFGDGNTGRGILPFHTFTVEDVYNVTLTVTDNGGKTDSVTKVVKVVGLADLRASITLNTPPPHPVDGSIEWLVTVSNDGPADEPSAEALIVLPLTVTLESADASQH